MAIRIPELVLSSFVFGEILLVPLYQKFRKNFFLPLSAGIKLPVFFEIPFQKAPVQGSLSGSFFLLSEPLSSPSGFPAPPEESFPVGTKSG